ncbi:MAG: prephenate dehydratase [Verrucomicrobiaceae bacterium]|nr:prephenate dehydratase [Verrucomicrobiaceae bacterium]
MSLSGKSPSCIACLGPEGSFSHLVAADRFPGVAVKALGTIGEVFDFMGQDVDALGVVPIENSSGGIIIDTVDRFAEGMSNLFVLEELTLDVKLALLGHAGGPVDVIYSHPMPFFHADEWLRQNHPSAKRVSLTSTAASAKRASEEPNAATLGPRQNADKHGLEILAYPINGETPNVTQFFVIGHQPNTPSLEQNRTALIAELPDRPGSLCSYLMPFRDAAVSLKRIESRPIRGRPNTYRFYLEIEGSVAHPGVHQALAKTETEGATNRILGSYVSGRRFES